MPIENRRLHFRKGLHVCYLPFYDALCSLLPAHFQPISGFRSLDKQATLYALGRTAVGPGANEKLPLGKTVTLAKPGLSFHQYGLASDWDYFDEDGNYAPLGYYDERWKEYLDACDKVGVKTLEFERPHNQLDIPVSAQALKHAFEEGGLRSLDAVIRGDAG